MRLPWKRKEVSSTVIPFDWIETHAWLGWEAPRNYTAGEAQYQRALARLTGPLCARGYCRPVVAQLVREPSNRYDPNAIRIEVAGVLVGYLRRQIAAQVSPALDRARVPTFSVAALLRGGSETAPNVGCHLWLDRVTTDDGPLVKLPQDDEWVVPWPINDRECSQFDAAPVR